MFKNKTKIGYYRILYNLAFLWAFALVIDMHERRRRRRRRRRRGSDGLLAATLCVADKYASECVCPLAAGRRMDLTMINIFSIERKRKFHFVLYVAVVILTVFRAIIFYILHFLSSYHSLLL